MILHSCDNERCFNPKHLRQGTAKDNAQDRILRNKKKRKSSTFVHERLNDPYDYITLLNFVKQHIQISSKDEWLYKGAKSGSGYPKLTIKGKTFFLHKLILANKLGLKYEDIDLACHKFPENSVFKNYQPQKLDVNPDHLYNGNAQQNINDTLAYHKMCSLLPQDVFSIREEARNVDFTKISANQFDLELAKKFNVTSDIIRNVRTGKSYQAFGLFEGAKESHAKQVIQLDMEGREIRRFNSIGEAARLLRFPFQNISLACNGKFKHYKGFKWCFNKKIEDKDIR